MTSQLGRRTSVIICSNVDDVGRLKLVKGAYYFCRSQGLQDAFVQAADRYRLSKRSYAAKETYLYALMENEQFDRAWHVFQSAFSPDDYAISSVQRIRIMLAFDLARYPDVVATINQTMVTDSQALRDHYDFLKGSFAAANCLKTDLALEFFCRQFKLISDVVVDAGPAHTEELSDLIIERAFASDNSTLLRKIYVERLHNPQARIGVFFASSTEALGHTILDAYHFFSLAKSRYDHMIIIGAERSAYRPASLTCLEILNQYGSYVTTHDAISLNLSWMSFGTISCGPIDFVVENYWSLLRQVVHRTQDTTDSFRLNQWHMSLPALFEEIGIAFCAKNGIRLDQPIVVLHARDHGYHGLSKQSHRNVDITDYGASVEFLLQEGYQVIRIGDQKMRTLAIGSDQYFELPYMEDYETRLDPFFIARADFMIGCQSGPCAYARAFGRPLLSVNAVYHYTLLPTPQEMGCFKRYYRVCGGERLELDFEEILNLRLFHLDTSHQFDQLGIQVEAVSSQEILASVQDMITWVKNPDLPETAEQTRFRLAIEKSAAEIKDAGDLALPIADYLGYVLPGYRISPSVARMRIKSSAESRREAESSAAAD